MCTNRLAIAVLSILVTTTATWGLLQWTSAPTQDIAVYFSPKGGAIDAILAERTAARSEIKAYSFTSAPDRSGTRQSTGSWGASHGVARRR